MPTGIIGVPPAGHFIAAPSTTTSHFIFHRATSRLLSPRLPSYRSYKAGLEDIEISPGPGYDWARRLVRGYLERSDITICATFDVPDALLKSNPMQGDEPNQ